MTGKQIIDLDVYGILNIEVSATTSEVRRAYKKKALKCHPDKNPDDPKAAELFHQLTKALEILLDEQARAAYDKLLKAKEAAKQRHSALDDRRKRFKEELEEREKAAFTYTSVSKEEKLQRDIERLRREGSRMVQEEIRAMQEELLEELKAESPSIDASLCQLKAVWNKDCDNSPSMYTEKSLKQIFQKYGDINAIVVSNCSALIEFQNPKAAEMAVKIEVGFMENRLKVTYASKKLRKEKKNREATSQSTETLAERTCRQAAERKRIIEQIMREDAGE